MKFLPAIHQRAAKPCPSPVVIWQKLLTCLLEQHYGLALNDTPFSDEAVIQEHIEAGISLVDVVNFWWKSTSWFVSTVGGLAGRGHLHTCGHHPDS